MNIQNSLRLDPRRGFDFGHDRVGLPAVPAERLAATPDPFAALYEDPENPSLPLWSRKEGHTNNMALQNVGDDPAFVGKIAPDTFKIRIYGSCPMDLDRNPGLHHVLNARRVAETRAEARRQKGRTLSLLDTLLGAARGDLPQPEPDVGSIPELLERLRGLPVLDGDEDSVTVGGIPLRVFPHGSSSHSLLLSNEQAGVQLHLFGSMENLGLIAARFGARWCVERGYTAGLRWLREVSDFLAVSITRDSLSELHLKADSTSRFTEGVVNNLRGYGTRSLVSYGHGESWTGFSTTGEGGKRSSEKVCDLVLYNKREAEKDDPYWADYWRRSGLAADAPLWRLECRFYRGGLKRFGIESASDLTPGAINHLWGYATGTYLVLCTKRTADNRPEDRRTSPLWAEFQACAPFLDATAPPRTEREKSCDFLPVFRQGFGCVRSSLFRAGVLASESVLVQMLDDFGSAAEAVEVDLRSVYSDGLRGLADALDAGETTLPETGLLDAFRAECWNLYEERRPSLGVDYIPAFRPSSWFEENAVEVA